jgi:hypothetical protein
MGLMFIEDRAAALTETRPSTCRRVHGMSKGGPAVVSNAA